MNNEPLQNHDLYTQVFNTLFSSTSISKSIQDVFNLLCVSFNANHIYICETNSDYNSTTVVHSLKCNSHKSHSTINDFSEFNDFLSESNYYYATDENLLPNDCNSLFIFKQDRNYNDCQYFVFEKETLPLWDSDQIEQLSVFSKVIMNYLLKYYFEEKATLNSLIDPLTKLANMVKFRMFSNSLFFQPVRKQYTLVYLNINNFKHINNNFSYSVGNNTLVAVAKKFTDFLKDDEIISRIGADLFVILIKTDRFDSLQNLLTSFDVVIKRDYSSSEEIIHIDFTYGIYDISDDVDDISAALDNALLAYKIAKDNERISFAYYDKELHKKTLKEKEVEATMSSSLKNGEFVIYYQPKFNLSNNTMVGAEALVRWITPLNEIIPPIEFIPLFERNGFVCELDLFIFEGVCKDLRKWMNDGIIVIPISVNFSKLHLTDPNFLKKLVAIIEKYDVPASLIEIELTETTFFDNYNILLEMITEIKDIGFLISMDDFGSGYSSLNLLKELPVDILKLDKDFLEKGLETRRERIIITNIVRMSKELEIKVISEGVETQNESDFLKGIGCDMAQGYLFAKPMPVKNFEQIIYS